MNSFELAARLVVGLLLILSNGFFVAIEFALTRARQFAEEEFLGDGHPSLERAWEMTHDLEIYLTTCQVGITASSIAVGIVAEPALASLFEPVFANTALAGIGSGAILAFLIINLVHLTHGEQTPTYLGVERSRQVCRYGATPLYWFSRVIAPLIAAGDRVAKWTLRRFGIEMTGAWIETEEDVIESRADLRNRLGSVLDRGDLSAERREEVMNALAVGERPVREVVTPVSEVVFLDADAPVEENLDRIGGSPHTRFPLIAGSTDDFRGIVYVPAVVDRLDELRTGETSFEAIAAPPMTIAADTRISDAVDRFQSERQELALVIEDGEVLGLITATDALEAVMGEIEDPLDAGDLDRG